MFAIATVMSYVVNLQSRRDEKGATAVEYGLLVALIAAVIVVAVALLGTKVTGAFTSITDQLPG
ncbi:Flp family type IVb pilin [Aeromicrobium fastidiosum]|uniref:Flp family type IVb pilin n=1 Tax=Aeromicrobium fastidiosum TaxID=52699 RepID=A0A641APR2_9ACTN|nr:Flp family type IVb pilin [Aeromicrobium fastidiosum]KAA1379672.1 Flp family type IVb pilin [Aeromicrobium fastidiosum]MBP2389148.1 pilus assembly protein Flp/PilA [Aeromicrobium fastidiosum]